MCLSGYVSVCISLCVCLSVCLCICMCVCLHVCLCQHLCKSQCIYSICVDNHMCVHRHFTDMGRPSRSSFPSHLFPDSERPRTKDVIEARWIVGMCLACSHSGRQAQQTLITVLNLKTDDVGERENEHKSKHCEVQRKESRIHELPAG